MRALAVAATLAALVVTGCGGDDSNTGDDSDGGAAARTLQLETQLTQRQRVPMDAPSGADQQLRLLGQLYTPGAARATGRTQTTCARAQRGAGEVYNCIVALVLREGTLYGLAVASQEGPPDGAIVGGSGKYAAARGTFKYGVRRGDRLALAVSLR